MWVTWWRTRGLRGPPANRQGRSSKLTPSRLRLENSTRPPGRVTRAIAASAAPRSDVVQGVEAVVAEHHEVEGRVGQPGEQRGVALAQVGAREPLAGQVEHLLRDVHPDVRRRRGREQPGGASAADADVEHVGTRPVADRGQRGRLPRVAVTVGGEARRPRPRRPTRSRRAQARPPWSLGTRVPATRRPSPGFEARRWRSSHLSHRGRGSSLALLAPSHRGGQSMTLVLCQCSPGKTFATEAPNRLETTSASTWR